MWRLSALAALTLLAGCTSSDEPLRFDATATMLHVLDQRAGKQLLQGFYPADGPGRWTGRTFSATLKPPPAAARKGAVLLLRFGIPGTSIAALHSIRLSAIVNGVELAPESYDKAGEFDYVRDVPAAAFRGGNAMVNFALDKALPPGTLDARELGVVAKTIGFEAK